MQILFQIQKYEKIRIPSLTRRMKNKNKNKFDRKILTSNFGPLKAHVQYFSQNLVYFYARIITVSSVDKNYPKT
jgi:hypothetical protein